MNSKERRETFHSLTASVQNVLLYLFLLVKQRL